MGFNEPQQLQASTRDRNWEGKHSYKNSVIWRGSAGYNARYQPDCFQEGPMRARKSRLAAASGHSHAVLMLSDSEMRSEADSPAGTLNKSRAKWLKSR